MLRHTPLLLMLACAAAAQPAKEEVVRFQSELSDGQRFVEQIGHGLVFRLNPGGGGWTIQVSPQVAPEKACEEYAAVVNGPYRAHNTLELYPSYDLTSWDIFQPEVAIAQEASESTASAPMPLQRGAPKRIPRRHPASVSYDFNFVLNCAANKRESAFLARLLGSADTPARYEDAVKKKNTSPQGKGLIWILDSRISNAPEEVEGKNYGKVDWLRFRVEIRFPPNADRLPVPDDWP